MSSASPASLQGPGWLQNVPAWARPSSTSQTTPSSTQPVARNDPAKTLRDVGAAQFITSGRYILPKPPPKLPSQLGALSGASGGFTHGYMASGRLEWNGQVTGQPKDRSDLPVESKPEIGGGVRQLSMGRYQSSSKRLFKCAYCSVSSRWNRRDISLHVLHVHVRRRAFRCRRCGYGTSKSASAVTVHCARTHPGRPAIIEDNLTILNAILPLHTRPGTVLVAFRRTNGIPIMNLDELEEYFGLSKLTTDSEETTKDSVPEHPEDSLIQYSRASPLDLSKDHLSGSGIAQPAVYPTPFHDVFSQDTIHRHYPGTFGSHRNRGSGERPMQADLATVATATVATATVAATVVPTVSSMSEWNREESGTKDAKSSSGGQQQQRTSASSKS